jgi:hypothetical protein
MPHLQREASDGFFLDADDGGGDTVRVEPGGFLAPGDFVRDVRFDVGDYVVQVNVV